MGSVSRIETDVVIVGSGVAGLTLALHLESKYRVCLVCKSELTATNSSMAQGGIAAVMATDDTFEDHIHDTLVAGAGLCNPEVVSKVVEHAPKSIENLTKLGVQFDLFGTHSEHESPGTPFDLTREGGHSRRRILHVQDHTGEAIHQQLLKKVRASQNIKIIESTFAVDLILNESRSQRAVVGVHAFDQKTWATLDIYSRATVLATGGAGKVYLYTSNWSGATGDGIAIAERAGARVTNLEFMQFHPTCLYHPDARNFLITEALRGEGAELINKKGEAFTRKGHALGPLAPRDIVARMIDSEMKRTGAECVFLDIRHRPADLIQSRFPVIYKNLKNYGIDMTQQPIPVVPAAHYLCGGVVSQLDGETDLKGLSTIGETACTGLHGANRLASNSLLECLVMADFAAERLLRELPDTPMPNPVIDEWSLVADRSEPEEQVAIAHMWDEIRRLMWNYVGIVRSDRRLESAASRLKLISDEIHRDHRLRLHPDSIELKNIARVAQLTVECAMLRKESRGIHWNLDHPRLLASAMDTIPERRLV